MPRVTSPRRSSWSDEDIRELNFAHQYAELARRGAPGSNRAITAAWEEAVVQFGLAVESGARRRAQAAARNRLKQSAARMRQQLMVVLGRRGFRDFLEWFKASDEYPGPIRGQDAALFGLPDAQRKTKRRKTTREGEAWLRRQLRGLRWPGPSS